MPRVRTSAQAFVVAVCLVAAPVASHARPTEADVQRRDELDAVQRQDVADALRLHFGITVDWRTTPLDRLLDIRLRAAKAADLQTKLGVSVDWQRYSWIELEALRRTLLSFEQYRNGNAPAATPLPRPLPLPRDTPLPLTEDALVRPTFKAYPPVPAGRSKDPDGVIRPTFSGRAVPAEVRDPDGVIRPTFVVRPRWSSVSADPDGLIAPTFAPTRRFAAIGDADDLMDPTRAAEIRSAVPARW